MKPKVSVVIPCYNYADYLRLCLQSVFNQTFQDFEIIVVDDGSTDNIELVVRQFKDPRIKYVRNRVNLGQTKSINIGLKLSSGEFITIIGADDLMLENNLDAKVKLLERNDNAGLCFSNAFVIDKDGNIKQLFYKGGQFPECPYNYFNLLLLKGNFIVASSVLVRRKCYDTLGFYKEDLNYGEDWNMWLRISLHYDFVYINEPLIKYRVHDRNLSKQIYKNFKDKKYIELIIDDLFEKYKLENHGYNKEKITKYHIFRTINNNFGNTKLIDIIKLYLQCVLANPYLIFTGENLKILAKIILTLILPKPGVDFIRNLYKKYKSVFS